MINDPRSYTKEHKKELGAFYTPTFLADLMASILLSYFKGNKDQCVNIVDPSTGDSVLLKAFSSLATKKGIKNRVIGIDIDELAIKRSYDSLLRESTDVKLINTDALYPLNKTSTQEGWSLY